MFCREKHVFVATRMILGAAPANDICRQNNRWCTDDSPSQTVNTLVASFGFIRYIQLVVVFSAVSIVHSFEADDDTHDLVGVGEKNKTINNCMLRCAMLTQFDLERKRSGENV